MRVHFWPERQRMSDTELLQRFVRGGGAWTWNPGAVLEPSDRATTYFDPRTMSKNDGMPAGMRGFAVRG